MCRTVRTTLRNARKNTRIKFSKTMAISTLMYGSEILTLKKSDETAIHSLKNEISKKSERMFHSG